MSDIFKLFDGGFTAGGAAAIQEQHGSSFSDVSPENDLVSRLASGSDSVPLLVDYSDFSNFVTFNSAQSYVTITADQILNDYPFGGTADDLQAFISALDGYQQYFLGRWPSRTGHLRFNPASSSSYVSILDFGIDSGVARTSMISPGTGSMTIQGWLDVPTLTGSNDVFVVFQKLRDVTSDGLTVYASGSQVFFQVSSGSTTVSVSGTIPAKPAFFSAVLDRSSLTGTVSLYMATTGTYPSLSDSATAIFGSRFDLASGSFYMGSGSLSGKVVRPISGSLDDVTVWSLARTLATMSGSYNRKVFSQPGLVGAWRFNEATDSTPSSYAAVVRDCSGHRLDGRIQRYFSALRGSGSLAYDVPDPILTLDDSSVVSYVVTAQTSGTTFDRSNGSLIFNLFPEAFTQADAQSGEVFQNFALILARHFDRINLYIKQLANLRRVSYGDFDQAPDELLEEIGRFLGFPLGANFASTDAMRYFLSRSVQAGPRGNAALDTSMSQIKAEFWRRALLNLMYIYKTKGTRESVEALLRTYGADSGFIRIKEYARRSEARLVAERVTAEKSVYTLMFVSGSSVTVVGH